MEIDLRSDVQGMVPVTCDICLQWPYILYLCNLCLVLEVKNTLAQDKKVEMTQKAVTDERIATNERLKTPCKDVSSRMH